MSDLFIFNVDFRDLFTAIGELRDATGKSMRTLLLQQSRLLMKQVLDITPPSGGGVVGRAAKKRGELAIDYDLDNVFSAVRLKGRRKVTHVFGKKLKKPVYVPTKELYPDVRAIYIERLAGTRAFRDRLGRGRRQAFYVDKTKLAALKRDQKAKVGKLASGWVPALRRLGVSGIANWITNKGNGGTVRLQLEGELIDFEATAAVKGTLAYELQRRLNGAGVMRAATIRRQIPFILAANARKANLAPR